MQIRKRLTLLFVGIFTLILLLSSLAIYVSSESYRQEDFYLRLQSKATNTANLLIQVEEIDLNLLQKIEQNNPISLPEEETFIFNFNNDLLYSSVDGLPPYCTDSLFNSIRLEEYIEFTIGQREVLGFLFKGTYDRFVVVTSATDIYGKKKVTNLLWVLLIVFSSSILAIGLAAWFFTTKAMSPIWRIIDQANKISINNLNIRLDQGNNEDELAKLALSFNQTLDRLESAFIVQKNFIANASHEIRTPLAIVTGQLEVLLLKDRSEAEYKNKLQSVLEDIKGLNKMSNKLLLLAQTSSERSTEEDELVRIDEILWQNKSELEKRYLTTSINIEFEESIDDESELSVTGNEQLLKIAFSNLIENACKYSNDHQCKISVGNKDALLVLTFKDNGIGIPAKDLPHIFEPFSRAQNATVFEKGHGIGLSLVKQIIESHSGRITVESTENKGSVFKVELPL